MNIETIAVEALSLPLDAIGYFVSRRLAELYPLKVIVEGDEHQFRPEEHSGDGQSEIRLSAGIHNQIDTSWYGAEYGLNHQVSNALYDVDWQDHSFQVLFLTWTEGGCRSRFHWIIADSKEVAEGYFTDVCNWCSEVRGEVLVFDGGHWYKSEDLYISIKTATFDNLILPGDQKGDIQRDFSRFFGSREVYERHGIPWKRGVLLIGPPGNGKTHTVKALANWLDKPCLYVKSFTHRYHTQQDCMRIVFDRARKTKPCLLVMEDLDSLLNDKNRSFFLNELDGFASNTGVVLLATTNHPERLDPAILERPSRFDRKYYFELPAPTERREYIRRWNDDLDRDLQVTEAGIEALVTATDGFSFAYLKELFLSSMMRWIDESAPQGMDAVMREQAEALRAQMTAAACQPMIAENAADDDDEED